MKNVIIAVLLFLSFSCSKKTTLVVSDRDGWQKIEESIVNFETEKEEINLVGSNSFAKLKLVVFDAPIELNDMKVFYENGKVQDVSLSKQMKEDEHSRVIDVYGKESPITKVVFTYKTIPNKEKEKGMVQLWGYKTNVDEKPTK